MILMFGMPCLITGAIVPPAMLKRHYDPETAIGSIMAASIGTFGALAAALHKRLTWPNLHAACMTTLVASAMVMWIIFGASIFVGFYILQGGQTFVQELISGAGLGPYAVLALMMVLLVALGMFLGWVGILLLAVSIFVPLIQSMSFDGVFGLPGVAPADVSPWFGFIYLVGMQMSILSPSFGYALLYIKGSARRISPWGSRSFARPSRFWASRPWPVPGHPLPGPGDLAVESRLRLSGRRVRHVQRSRSGALSLQTVTR